MAINTFEALVMRQSKGMLDVGEEIGKWYARILDALSDTTRQLLIIFKIGSKISKRDERGVFF
jgi:hypothetical protein